MSSDRRGDEIRFIGGTYIGYRGWLDKSRDETERSYPVIVQGFKKKTGGTVDKAATVRKSSCAPAAIPSPTSYAMAIMQQHPKIDQLMGKLCIQLAKCELKSNSTSIHALFTEKLKEAVAKQIALGRDAEWKRVRYTSNAVDSDL
jgi:hypothetical protein